MFVTPQRLSLSFLAEKKSSFFRHLCGSPLRNFLETKCSILVSETKIVLFSTDGLFHLCMGTFPKTQSQANK